MRAITGTVSENRTGGQAYTTGRVARDRTFPLELCGELRAITAPIDGVVQSPCDADLSSPLELTVANLEADRRTAGPGRADVSTPDGYPNPRVTVLPSANSSTTTMSASGLAGSTN